MAQSLNKIALIGRVGQDPEARTMQSGGKVVSFSLATSESWNDKASGERKENTQWHRIVIFNDRIGDVAEKYVHKGDMLYVEGQMEYRKYTDQAGNEKTTAEVVLRPFNGVLNMLSSKSGGESGGNGGGQTRGNYTQRQAPQGGGRGAAPQDDLEDQIPF